MRTRFVSAWLVSVICMTSVALCAIGCGGTRAGSPEAPAEVSLKFSAKTQAALTSLTLCPSAVHFYTAGSSSPASSHSLTPSDISIGASPTAIATISVPKGTYSGMIVTLTPSGASGKSLSVQNGLLLDTAQSINLSFAGSVPISSSAQEVELNLQPVESVLVSANGGSDLKAVTESVIGTVASQVYLSDLAFLSETNASGPIERDTTVGGASPGDGLPIVVGSTSYAKGVGVSISSEFEIDLAGQYSTLVAEVGVNMGQTSCSGTVLFDVINSGTGVTIGNSWGMYGGSTNNLTVSVAGLSAIKLRVTSGGSCTQAVWAGAKLLR